jgi:hypothetical protein
VGEYETGKKKSGTQELLAWPLLRIRCIRKKRWKKTVVLNLNAELQEERYRQGFHEGGYTIIRLENPSKQLTLLVL